MGLNPEELDDVQTLAALGDGDAQLLADDAARADPARRDHEDVLHRTVAALDQLLEAAPPPDLRARLLDAAAQRPRELAEPASVRDLFRRQIEALGDLLGDLHADDWTRPIGPYRWTVHGLVAHLLVIELYTAGQLGLDQANTSHEHHLAIGADRIAAELADAPGSTARRWLERARATAAALFDDGISLPDDITLHGWPFSTEGALIARAFEVWTHADDIRLATGRPRSTPGAGDLRTMSRFSVRTLPRLLPLVAPEARLAPTRIVLTGDGGGTFDIGGNDGQGDAATTVVTDVVDYCRVVARRIRVDELACDIDGNEEIVRALLAAASAFAV